MYRQTDDVCLQGVAPRLHRVPAGTADSSQCLLGLQDPFFHPDPFALLQALLVQRTRGRVVFVHLTTNLIRAFDQTMREKSHLPQRAEIK